MIENDTLARPYAKAVINQAQADESLQQWSDCLEFLEIVVKDQAMEQLIKDPRIAKTRLTDLVLVLGAGRFSQMQQNFVKLLVENGRLQLAPSIHRLFGQLRAEAEDTLDVEISSPHQLTSQQLDRISALVKKRLGKAIEVTTRIDASLIGGLVVKAGDFVIDASLRGRLKQLQNGV